MPGRNDPCLCGSGRKYKRCCGATGEAAPASEEREHGQLVDEVTGWADRDSPGELRAALLEYLGDRREITEDEENCAAAWFLHDRELPGGQTPLERYADTGRNHGSGSSRPRTPRRSSASGACSTPTPGNNS